MFTVDPNTFNLWFQTAGLYRWTDNWPVVYTNWGSGEPVDGPGRGCGAMGSQGEWNNTVCSKQLQFFCKTTTSKSVLYNRCIC